MLSKEFTRTLLLGLAAWAGLTHASWAQGRGPSPELRRPAPTSVLRPAPARSRAQLKTAARIAAQRTNPHSRLSGDLQRLYQTAARPTATKGSLRTSFPRLHLNATASAVLVRITAQDVEALLPSLTSRGFVVISSYPDLHFVEGMLPVSQLAVGAAGIEGLAAKGLMGVLPSLRPRRHVGAVTNEADYVLEAARARAIRPRQLDGTGVRIGIMSDSYNSQQGAAAGVASGDLPAGVQVLQDLSDEDGGTDEGRAMAELIHDLAPGSPLAFSSVEYGEGDFAQQVLNLADPAKGNCKVLTDDIAYFTEPYYQEGVIGRSINQVVAGRGAVYFSAAGNQADQAYESIAPRFVQPTRRGNGTSTAAAYRLNFDTSGATTDTTQTIRLGNGQEFFPILQWSDPFYTKSGVKTDLNMYLIAVKAGVQTTDTVAFSNDNNLLSATPIEGLDFTNDSLSTGTNTFNLVITRRADTPTPARLKYINYSDSEGGPSEWNTYSSTITAHAAAANAFAVAAAGYLDQRGPEYYTSKGGTITILYGVNGTLLSTPATRFKPDITSVDGGSTTFFGQQLPAASDTNYHFFGTSAAAPCAAAVAALLRQSEPALTPDQVYARLTSTARDINTAGVDNLTGAGLLDAFTAIYGPVAAATPPATEDLEKYALPTSWEVYSNGAGRVQVRTTDGPASGTHHLVLDATYNFSQGNQSRNEATWYLTGVNASSLQLNFRERKFAGETDEPMPASFRGSSNSDGVALSVDGTNWYRVADLTGTNATTTYQTKSVNLTQLAAANGLTLGNTVRLKFQQYGGTARAAAATASNQQGRLFDDISLTAVNPAPVPLYRNSAAVGCPGLVVAFADTSELRPTAWAWTFPGGTPATSTQRNPSVTYATAGHYGVTLTVTNAAGLRATRADTGVVFVSGRVPQATAAATRTSICPGGQTVFSSTAAYCPSTYAWTFPGGTPATATVPNPGAVTYATAGTYTATLTVSNGYGATTSTVAIEVTNGRALPFAETFDAALTLPAGWTSVNPDGQYGWIVRDTTISRSGARSRVLRAPFAFDPNTGEHDAVYTPALNLRTAQPTLLFDLAYAPYETGVTYRDSLSIQVVDACSGAVLGTPYAKGSAGTLPTAAGRGILFVPKSRTDWRQERVDLTPYAGRSVVLRFVGRNGFGNSLYLDNVQVGNNLLALTAAASTVGFEAWPNPVPLGTSLTLRLPPYSGSVALRLVDNLGRVVWQEQVEQRGAALERTLQPAVAKGLYNLLYLPATGTAAARRIAIE